MQHDYGVQEARSIGGQTSACEVAELMGEGIEVMPLPLTAAVKETLPQGCVSHRLRWQRSQLCAGAARRWRAMLLVI